MALLARLFAGPVLDAVMEAFRTVQSRKMSETQARAEVEKALMNALRGMETAAIEARGKALLAEISGESWLQRNWRPVVALTAFFSYWHIIVVIPHLVSWGWMAPPRFGERGLENLFWLTTICAGGYIAGRTAEKIAGRIHQ
jgi:hypothetical protein